MLTLVTGGAASGKSAYAESLIRHQPSDKRIYIATMQVSDEESRQRVWRHRQRRAGLGFQTIECHNNLKSIELLPNAAVLVEDLGNLLAGEMFGEGGAGDEAVSAILAGLDRICALSAGVVVVGNDIFADTAELSWDSQRYLSALAALNKALAKRAIAVFEVVCGIAICHKGGKAGASS